MHEIFVNLTKEKHSFTIYFFLVRFDYEEDVRGYGNASKENTLSASSNEKSSLLKKPVLLFHETNGKFIYLVSCSPPPLPPPSCVLVCHKLPVKVKSFLFIFDQTYSS